jgi:hypothetical protein
VARQCLSVYAGEAEDIWADAKAASDRIPTGSVRVDRLDNRKPVGMGLLHFHRIAAIVAVHRKGEMKIAPSTPTLSIAATISLARV